MKQEVSRRNLLLGAGAAVATGAFGQEQAMGDYGVVPALAGKRAIVIGSGFGGAVAAYRLGQAGLRVTVLERGRRWDADGSGTTFCTAGDPDWRCAWFGDRPPLGPGTGTTIERRAGLIDRHVGDGITVLSGAGGGGGSLVMGMFMTQPRRAEWARHPRAAVRRWTGPTGRGPAPPNATPVGGHRSGAAGAGAGARSGDRARARPRCPSRWRSTGTPCGRSCAAPRPRATPWARRLGSNPARATVSTATTRWATATGNVTIRALHEVTEIHELAEGAGFEVKCRQINEFGDVLATRALACDYLFLAAGTVHTNSLLVTARAKGWLPRLRASVGKGFGNNGSVQDYFKEVSGGTLQYTNIVAPYYKTQYPRSYYTNEAIPQPRRATRS
jgi:cholesterol oxidase